MTHRIEYGLFKAAQWLLHFLPLKSVQRLGAGMGLAAYYVVGNRRATALDNLVHAFPDGKIAELRAIAKRSFMNYGTTLFEFFWFPSLTLDVLDHLFRPEDFTLVREVIARGKGGLFLTGHIGSWELLALGAARYGGDTFAVIVQTQSNKYFDDEINRYRSKFGNRVVPMGISVREIIRTLQQGGVVAVAGDQSGPREGVFVDFFGRKVATHQGPAVFALKCRVPLILGLSVRRPDGGFDVTFEEIVSSDLIGATEENVLELTRRHTSALERAIRRHPDQWLWMHRRWKHTWESVQKELAGERGSDE